MEVLCISKNIFLLISLLSQYSYAESYASQNVDIEQNKERESSSSMSMLGTMVKALRYIGEQQAVSSNSNETYKETMPTGEYELLLKEIDSRKVNYSATEIPKYQVEERILHTSSELRQKSFQLKKLQEQRRVYFTNINSLKQNIIIKFIIKY